MQSGETVGMCEHGESGCLREGAHALGLAEPADPSDVELDYVERFSVD